MHQIILSATRPNGDEAVLTIAGDAAVCLDLAAAFKATCDRDGFDIVRGSEDAPTSAEVAQLKASVSLILNPPTPAPEDPPEEGTGQEDDGETE